MCVNNLPRVIVWKSVHCNGWGLGSSDVSESLCFESETFRQIWFAFVYK